MSVWPGYSDSHRTLEGSEGALISIAVHVEPRYLEALLETLARLSFPINPQIYHDASIVYVYPDGREEVEPTTLVEFPAYESRLAEVRRVLSAYGFSPDALHATGMLDGIESDALEEAAPEGAGYVKRVFRRHADSVVC